MPAIRVLLQPCLSFDNLTAHHRFHDDHGRSVCENCENLANIAEKVGLGRAEWKEINSGKTDCDDHVPDSGHISARMAALECPIRSHCRRDAAQGRQWQLNQKGRHQCLCSDLAYFGMALVCQNPSYRSRPKFNAKNTNHSPFNSDLRYNACKKLLEFLETPCPRHFWQSSLKTVVHTYYMKKIWRVGKTQFFKYYFQVMIKSVTNPIIYAVRIPEIRQFMISLWDWECYGPSKEQTKHENTIALRSEDNSRVSNNEPNPLDESRCLQLDTYCKLNGKVTQESLLWSFAFLQCAVFVVFWPCWKIHFHWVLKSSTVVSEYCIHIRVFRNYWVRDYFFWLLIEYPTHRIVYWRNPKQ